MQRMNDSRLGYFVSELQQFVDGHACNMKMVGIRPPVQNECGTPGCHAGIARLVLHNMGRRRGFSWVIDANGYLCNLGYENGIEELNAYLLTVLSNETPNLELWAARNPVLWGNHYGDRMFSCGLAFGQDSDVFPATVLADHWCGVLARVRLQYDKEARIVQQHYGLENPPDYEAVGLELMLLEARIKNKAATPENHRLWESLMEVETA